MDFCGIYDGKDVVHHSEEALTGGSKEFKLWDGSEDSDDFVVVVAESCHLSCFENIVHFKMDQGRVHVLCHE